MKVSDLRYLLARLPAEFDSVEVPAYGLHGVGDVIEDRSTLALAVHSNGISVSQATTGIARITIFLDQPGKETQ